MLGHPGSASPPPARPRPPPHPPPPPPTPTPPHPHPHPPRARSHETTAAVLTWALFSVAQAPAVEARLLAEVDAAVGDRDPGAGKP